MTFRDRIHAGKHLARSLGQFAERGDVIVLGLPRGGVPVANEIAEALDLPLDVMLVRKLGVPGQEELAMGAIAGGGVRVVNRDVTEPLGITASAIERAVIEESRELERREKLYRAGRPPLTLRGHTVILVDDGMATGSTMRAAVETTRAAEAARIIVAVPVGSPEACQDLSGIADRVVCPLQPESFGAISLWYEHFEQTSDQEVQSILDHSYLERFGIAHGRPGRRESI